MTIGTITRLPIRSVWQHEAHSFTTWLVDHIQELGDAIGLDLADAEREQAAGNFSVDIVATDRNGDIVIVENQYGRSDHDHLGKVVTYLAAFDARTAIWVVEEARPEHVQAVTWLNEASSGAFYVVKLEVIRIGDSQPAPLFTKIVGPSEVARQVGVIKRELTGSELVRYEFWEQLLAHAASRTKLHAGLTPGKYSWIGTTGGRMGFNWNYSITRGGTKAELYIDTGDEAQNIASFNRILQHRLQVEEAYGGELSWQPLEDRRACRIAAIFDDGGYATDTDQWPRLMHQLVDSMIRLEAALRPYL